MDAMMSPTAGMDTQMIQRSSRTPQSFRRSAKSWAHIVVAGVGMGLGFGGSAFGFHFKNSHTGIWGIPTGTVGGMLLHLAILNKAGYIESWYSPKILGGLMKIAILFIVVGAISFTIYVTVAVLNHRGQMYPNSFYYTAIENSFTILLAIYLAVFAWRLKLKMERQYASLLGGVRPYPDDDE